MTPKTVYDAWHSVKDRWLIREQFDETEPRWTVVHCQKDDTGFERMIRVGGFKSKHVAKAMASQLENEARGTAVLRALGQ